MQRTQFIAGEAVLTDQYPARVGGLGKVREQGILPFNTR